MAPEPCLILCIETATEVCSVAIGSNDKVLYAAQLEEGLKHSELLTTLIKDVTSAAQLRLQDLHAVAISHGPGSYTGLRVGASTAKAICYALDIPLIAVPTLETLAWPYRLSEYVVIPAIDARRMEAYTAVYKNGKVLRHTESTIWTESIFVDLVNNYGPILICGNGIEKGRHLVPNKGVDLCPSLCDARHLVGLAYKKYLALAFEDIAYYDPYYFKSPNITTPKRISFS